jgi:hypothetical protein
LKVHLLVWSHVGKLSGVQLPAGVDPTLCIDPARPPAAAGLLDGSDAPPSVEPNFEAHHSHRATPAGLG